MIRFSQLVLPSQNPIPADTTNPNFSYDKGGNIAGEGGYLSESKIREIQNNIQSDLQKLDPIIISIIKKSRFKKITIDLKIDNDC